MSRSSRDRTRALYRAEPVDRPTEPLLVRLRSGLALSGLVVVLGVLTALATVIIIVIALALATTATS